MSKTKHDLATIHPLEALCIANDWSYAQLADRIAEATGVRRDQSTWLRICKGKGKAAPRTQRAIDRFLNGLQDRVAS